MKKNPIVFFSLVLVSIFYLSFPKQLSAATDVGSSLKNLACIYPVKISGQSLEPRVKEGSVLMLNKCIEGKTDNLPMGTIVLFKKFGNASVRIVREKIDAPDGIHYKVSRESTPENLDDIIPSDIIAIQTEKEAEASPKASLQNYKDTAPFKPNPMMIVAGILTTAVFFVATFYWKRKTGAGWRYFWAAMLVWSLMFAVKMAMDFTVNSIIYPLGLVVLAFYFGLRTGILENLMTYFYARWKFPQIDFNQAVFYGIAFGGAEALLIGLQSTVMAALFTFQPDILNVFPANLRQEFITAYSAPSLIIFAPVVERVSALFVHIAAILLAFLTLRTRKIQYLLYAIMLKGFIDGSIIPLTQIPQLSALQVSSYLLWAYIMEVPIAIYGIISYLIIIWVKKIYPVSSAKSLS